jgi:hypothetical protein
MATTPLSPARWIVSSYDRGVAHLVPANSPGYRTRCDERIGITREAMLSDHICWACTALAEGDAVVRGEN